MAGIVSLYAAILQTTPFESPPGPLPNADALRLIPKHFRPAAGWTWLVRILKPPLVTLEPVPQLLDSFLNVCGPALFEIYGHQFVKLCATILDDGIVQNKAQFAPKSRPSLVKLHLLFESWLQAGQISVYSRSTDGRLDYLCTLAKTPLQVLRR